MKGLKGLGIKSFLNQPTHVFLRRQSKMSETTEPRRERGRKGGRGREGEREREREGEREREREGGREGGREE